MEVKTFDRDGVVVFQVNGEINISTSPELKKSYEKQPMRLVPLKDDGTHDMSALNGDFSTEYLASRGNPRSPLLERPVVMFLFLLVVGFAGAFLAIAAIMALT